MIGTGSDLGTLSGLLLLQHAGGGTDDMSSWPAFDAVYQMFGAHEVEGDEERFILVGRRRSFIEDLNGRRWSIDSKHADCEGCERLAFGAIVHAISSGSLGSRYSESHQGRELHSVHVSRREIR